jgi:hypothetical protein
MSYLDWLEIAVMFLFVGCAGNKLRKQYSRGDIFRSMSLAGMMASFGVVVYS